MQQSIQTAIRGAKSAESTLVEAIHGAADALDMIGRDPLSEALTRLRESAEAAKSRLQAGRMLASGILADALAGFVTFEGEMGAEEVLEVPTIALPPVEVVEPAEQVTATAANAVAEAAPVAPLAPVEEFPPTPEELADAEAPPTDGEWYPHSDPSNPYPHELGEAPPKGHKRNARKAKKR
jgi:hypothetical protein